MKFLRENIVKIALVFGILIVIVIVLIACSGGGTSVGKGRSYSKIEDNFKNAATKFLQKHGDLLPTEEGKTIQVQMSSIYTEKEMKKIVSPEDSNVKCDGYANVNFKFNDNGDKVYRVVPHIKCGDLYETEDLYVHILKNEDIVTSLDGLYKIGNEYVYRGENPNNYIQLGVHLYRILSIDEDGFIKLINAEQLPTSVIWDDRYNKDIQRSDGINDYYVSRVRAAILEFYSSGDYYTDSERNLFVKRNYCIGRRSSSNIGISRDEECQQTSDEDFVSLPMLYDYFIASVDPDCKTIYDKTCGNYNYLTEITPFLTLTASKDNTYDVYVADVPAYADVARSHEKLSLVTFIADVSYSSGKGTLADPYIVK